MIKNENLILSLYLFWLCALRIDAEASSIKEKLDKIKPIQQQSNEGDDKLSEEVRLIQLIMDAQLYRHKYI